MIRRLALILMALVMVSTTLPAMGQSESEAELEPVVLDWYFGQEEMDDCAIVNDAVNEYLTEKINTKVNLHYWSGTEYWDKMTTMISAGQDVGIIGFGAQTYLDYVVQSRRGAYYPLDELLTEYAPDTYALFPDNIWDGMKINGHIYGIPTKKDNGYYISIVYNDTMAQELGINMDEVKYTSWRDVEDLGLKVKELRNAAHPEWADYPVFGDNTNIAPYNFAVETFLNDNYLAVCDIDAFNTLADSDETQVVNLYETPEFREYCIQRQRMVDEGLYAYDYTDKAEWSYTGGMFAWVSWGYAWMQDHLYGDKFITKMKICDNLWTDTNNYFSAGTAISSNCAEPERAMMVLNLINTDPEFATMMRFGIEGKHYNIDADGKMTFEGTPNADISTQTYYYWYMPTVGNLLIVNAPESLAGPDRTLFNNLAEYNKNCVVPAHFGFTLDIEPIKNEVAACSNVIAEYQQDFIRGQLSDADEVNEALDEFIAKLKANGGDEIREEVQRQIDAWKQSK